MRNSNLRSHWTRSAAILAGVVLVTWLSLPSRAHAAAIGILADADEDLNTSAEVKDWYANNGKIKVKVTDKNGAGVANKWVSVNDGTWCIGPTGADGTAEAKVASESIPTIKKTGIQDPRAGGKDPHGLLSFDAASLMLSYLGGTMQEVWYNDGSHVFGNGPSETILGASVSMQGMMFLGVDVLGQPRFTDGTLTISSGLGTSVLATYSDVRLWTDPSTGDNVLWGEPGGFQLNHALGSRFVDDLAVELTTFRPAFYLESSSSLAAATGNFSINGSITVDGCPFGTSASGVPEPSNWVISAIGILAVAAGCWRRREKKKDYAA